MAAEKVTVMILQVDLQCPCCYKKIKKILSKFPQIKSQVFDEKANKVTISVFYCSPEKIRDKLCAKGCKVIKSTEILEPPKPKPKEPEKPKETEKPAPPPETPKDAPKPSPPKMPDPMPMAAAQGYPPYLLVRTCSEGYGGGPCYNGYYGNGGGYHDRCYYYMNEENPEGCSIL